MGIKTVAIYSEADRFSPHVRLADEAYCVGPVSSVESYLNQERIIEIAKRSQADAIHPGYGFLAENPDFAKLVEDNGIVFIGPPSHVIRSMGDKTAARNTMVKSGVPVVPGAMEAIANESDAIRLAETIGYPVLIKAAAGGGGKGMRIVHSKDDLLSSMKASQNEARSAFGDDRIYIEKYLENPRHIEFQILADSYGNTIHLGERECSIQRRYQKIVEESPSSIVTPDLRKRMGEAAVTAAKASSYVNAGTVEFLLDKNKDFYFLEVNTRLQVEHPVTEMVTGIDIVKEQIRIASGEPLRFTQDEIHSRGHAIECRIYAEDPENNFLPSIGKITRLRPPQGFGIREDSGVEEGQEISIYYDPLISKLIVWGENRTEAIARMRRALLNYQISGVKTTIPFCLFVMGHPNFINGDFDTHFVQNYFHPDNLRSHNDEIEIAAVIASVLAEMDSKPISISDYPARPNSFDQKRGVTQGWKIKRFDVFRS